MREWENQVLAWWATMRGRVLGTALGLLLGWLVLRIGVWQAFILAVFLYIGYSVGRSFDPE